MSLIKGLLQTSSTVTLLGTVLFLLVLYLRSSGSSSEEQGKEPPGPRPLPLLGNMLQLDLKKPYCTLCELSKKYGSIFTVHFGPKKVVVLAGYKMVKQALVNQAEDFGDRDITPVFYDFNQGHGILFTNGDSWKEMRRFALTNLRDFGMGKKGSEEKILEEIPYLIEVLEKHEGRTADILNKPLAPTPPKKVPEQQVSSSDFADNYFEKMIGTDIQNYINISTIFVIPYRIGLHKIFCTCVCSLFCSLPWLFEVQTTVSRLSVGPGVNILMYNMFPWLGPWINNLTRLKKNVADLKMEVTELARGLKETLNPHMCRGFVDSFLVRKKTLEESGKMDSFYHDDNLFFSVGNLFGAGTDTTGTTLRWGLLLMAKYPHIQDQVQEEISRVIGSRQTLVEDRKNLPYTNAVIHETQRLANIAPMAVPHTTSRDVTFQGYFIKKGTSVIPLLTSVLQDDSEWESPHTFNPSHFLDEQGGFVKRDAFMAFSAGRRVCLGEGLARMELFLFFTSLLQRFRFSPPPGVTEYDLDLTPLPGFTLHPSPHQLCAVSRV
ncbi:cytochrome P450 2K1-like [Oncorhynchus kisutch]|uniref:cytochrome P450 2K1-like n=1 Tax=Oncorhynchus kisutch TaxID=8019 RepID=UPI0012DDD283|nr:cytochrome P450 2K1-like [Oncorhynchus kisutch]